MRKTIHGERIDMTPAPRFAEYDADEGRDFHCTSPVDPTYVLRKLMRSGAEVEPLDGGIEAEPAPRGTDVASAIAWLEAGAEVEPAVGGKEIEPSLGGT